MWLMIPFQQRPRWRSALGGLVGISLGLAWIATATGQQRDVWIGTGQADGIFHATLDTETGRISTPTSMQTLGGAGFLAMSPDGKTLYATATDGDRDGVASYDIVRTGNRAALRQTGFVISGDGRAACVAVDRTGRVVMSAQYGGGSVSTYLTDPQTRAIVTRVQVEEHGTGSGVEPRRQATAHPHWVGTSPDNRFLLVPDLGMDAVVIYRLNADTGSIARTAVIDCPPGGGPRHMKFHPNGTFAYVLNEMKLTISAFEFDVATAAMTPIQEIATLPDSLKDSYLNSAAEIRIHPEGRFVYASNRGHDSIAAFEVDRNTGKLSLIERESIRGSIPRNFNLDPSGQWLLAGGQRSNTLASFQVDPDTGSLTYTRQIVNVPNPICVEFGKP